MTAARSSVNGVSAEPASAPLSRFQGPVHAGPFSLAVRDRPEDLGRERTPKRRGTTPGAEVSLDAGDGRWSTGGGASGLTHQRAPD